MFIKMTLQEQYIRKLIKKQLKTVFKSELRGTLISESVISNKSIVNVDIQPEYKDYITFKVHEWVNFLNKSHNNTIVFLYNGADTLGMIDEKSYFAWLYEIGIKEEVLDSAIFYDKGYAYFRYCMDSNISEDSIVNLVKFMIKYNINDSRDINTKFWDKFIKEYPDDDYGTGELRSLLENASDMINIPDLMDFLKKYNDIVLTGGGINQCLKEVEIALMALGKQYNVLSNYTY